MKNILNFENHSSYNIFYNDIPINNVDGNYYKPNIISICKNEKDIHFNKKEHIIPIEYLESPGNIGNIETDFIPTGQDIHIQGKFNLKGYGSTGAWSNIMGTYSGEDYNAYRIIRQSTSTTAIALYNGQKANSGNTNVSYTLNTICTFDLNGLNYTLGSASGKLKANWYGLENTTSFIFRGLHKVVYYYIKIYKNNVLMADFIPVRIGQTGYIYNKVSGQLFGNSGSGSFILGPDIQPIEYLQSTGTQYIDTEYIPNATTQLYIEFSVVSYNTNMAQATSPFGVRIGWQNKQFALFCPVNNVKQSVVCYGNVGQSNTDTTINLNQKYICDVNKTIWLLNHSNGTNIISKTFTVTDASNLPNLHLWLFKYNNNNTMPGGDDILNIYKCTIKENDVLIHDLIPVRVGQVGYVYDKVSGKLFGNSGTGNFILGQDI